MGKSGIKKTPCLSKKSGLTSLKYQRTLSFLNKKFTIKCKYHVQ